MENMDWKTFTAIPNGTKVLNHGWDQCVALANLYHEDVFGKAFVNVPSAYMWWTRFGEFPQLAENYTQSQTPAAGAIFVSRYGIYDAPNGHIGVVTAVNPDGTFETMEQNAGTWRYVGRYTRDMSNVLGFLIPTPSPTTPSKPAPLHGMEDAMIVYYENGQGKGKPGWLILGYTSKPLILSTQAAANEWASRIGAAITTDKGGFHKYLTSAGGSRAQLSKIA